MTRISAPNYTQLPNVILDALPTFSECELVVVLAICRNTFGWHQERAALTLVRLAEITGRSNGGITNALKSLETRGLITVTHCVHGNSYAISVDGLEIPQILYSTPSSGVLALHPVENPNKERKRKETRVVFPEGLATDEFKAAWAKWERHRVEIKKPLTPTSLEQQLRDMAAMGERRAIVAIEFTISQGWQGLKEPTSSSPLAGRKRHHITGAYLD